MRSSVSSDYVNLVTVRAETENGEVSVAGTLVGKRNDQRVLQVNGYDIEMAPASNMLFFEYEDRPGVIGQVGTILGRHDINIATMDVGRASRGGTGPDGAHARQPGVAQDVIDEITSAIGGRAARFIVLPG